MLLLHLGWIITYLDLDELVTCKTIVIPINICITIVTLLKDDGTVTFHTVYQRSKSVNDFVGLDDRSDAEANSFIRGGLGGDP